MRFDTVFGCSNEMIYTFIKMQGEVEYNSSTSIDYMNEMPFFKRALDWYSKYN